MNRRGHAGRVDANQAAIVNALRRVGVTVKVTSIVGDGFDDLVCAIPEETFLLEVKEVGGKLTVAEKRWHRECPWRNHVVYDIEQALAIVSYYRGRLVRRSA